MIQDPTQNGGVSMQQKRNKRAPELTLERARFIRERFDDSEVADMLADDWVGVDEQDAIELFELIYARNIDRRAAGLEPFALPSPVAEKVLECAWHGLGKNPRNDFVLASQDEAVVQWANERWVHLEIAESERQPGVDPKTQAAQEAAVLAKQEYGRRHRPHLSAVSIEARMRKKQDPVLNLLAPPQV
jgi:hypothetical protein